MHCQSAQAEPQRAGRLCRGCCGSSQIINKLDEYDVQYMTLEKAVKVLQQAAQQTPCAPVGVRLLVGGRGRKGDFHW